MKGLEKKCIVDDQKTEGIGIVIVPTDSIQPTDIYNLIKETDGWLTVKDICEHFSNGENCNPYAAIKVRRMLKSMLRRKFILKAKKEGNSWGHEYKYKFNKGD